MYSLIQASLLGASDRIPNFRPSLASFIKVSLTPGYKIKELSLAFLYSTIPAAKYL